MGKGGARLPVSRSGLWLIGGTLVVSLGVLTWAFQEEAPKTVRRPRASSRPLAVRERTDQATSKRASGMTVAARPPEASEYAPLLGGNLFRPRVSSGKGTRTTYRSFPILPPALPKSQELRAKSGPISTDAWRGWRFNGVAQLDQKTYALMDQPGQKRSRFVRPGDRLEDAMVAVVAADRVILRPVEGGRVEIARVDAMAELLRPSRSPLSAPRTAPGGQPAAPAPAPGAAPPLATSPTGFRFGAEASPDLTTFDTDDPEARRAARERRSLEQRGFEPAGDPASSEE